jgi:hypothetical protein
MKRLSEFFVLFLLVGAVGGAARARARAPARPPRRPPPPEGDVGPEPQLGDWRSGSPDEVELQLQRVTTEIDNGTRVARDDYFRLADFKVDARVAGSCRADFGDVQIPSDRKFRVRRDQWVVEGEVLNPTTIQLDLLAIARSVQHCPGIGPEDLHPVGRTVRP